MHVFNDIATVFGAIVAAAAIWGSVGAAYRRSIGRRGEHYRRLSRLGTNAQLSYFSAILGAPPALKRALAANASAEGQGAQVDYANCVWVDPWYFVAALIDRDEGIKAFSVITRDKRFRPIFRSGTTETRPVLVAQLGRTSFAEVPPRPARVTSSLGARRLGYVETFYLGNPGNYQTFGLAVNDAGHIGRLVTPFPSLHRDVGTAPDPKFDEGEVRRFRQSTTVNCWIVLAPGVNAGNIPLLYWPDKDELRTFA